MDWPRPTPLLTESKQKQFFTPPLSLPVCSACSAAPIFTRSPRKHPWGEQSERAKPPSVLGAGGSPCIGGGWYLSPCIGGEYCPTPCLPPMILLASDRRPVSRGSVAGQQGTCSLTSGELSCHQAVKGETPLRSKHLT